MRIRSLLFAFTILAHCSAFVASEASGPGAGTAVRSLHLPADALDLSPFAEAPSDLPASRICS